MVGNIRALEEDKNCWVTIESYRYTGKEGHLCCIVLLRNGR